MPRLDAKLTITIGDPGGVTITILADQPPAGVELRCGQVCIYITREKLGAVIDGLERALRHA